MISPTVILRDIPEPPSFLDVNLSPTNKATPIIARVGPPLIRTSSQQDHRSGQDPSQDWEKWGKWEPADSQPTTKPNQTWWDSSTHHAQDTANKPHPAARLSAAPKSFHTKPLTAYSHPQHSHFSKPAPPSKKRKPFKNQWQDKHKSHQPSSRESTPLREGHIRLTFTDDAQADWVKKVKFALHHKSRMKAACEPGGRKSKTSSHG